MTLDRDDDIRLAGEDADQAELRTDLDETSLSDEEQAEAAEIRAEIEETRLEMGGTLNELGERLDPGNLVNQAKENVREATIGRVEETAKGMSEMVMETIKRNPIPAAMAGAGLALLWANRSQGQNGHGQYRTDDRAYGGAGYGYRDSRMAWPTEVGQRGGQGGGQGIGSKVGDAASTVGEKASGAVGTVAEGAQQVGGEVVNRAGQAVDEVGWRFERFMQASPLAMGAIAIGAGAVVGSIIPETPQERQVLGDASRQVADTVRQTVDQATSKAEETLDKTEEKVATGS